MNTFKQVSAGSIRKEEVVTKQFKNDALIVGKKPNTKWPCGLGFS